MRFSAGIVAGIAAAVGAIAWLKSAKAKTSGPALLAFDAASGASAQVRGTSGHTWMVTRDRLPGPPANYWKMTIWTGIGGQMTPVAIYVQVGDDATTRTAVQRLGADVALQDAAFTDFGCKAPVSSVPTSSSTPSMQV